jgi:uncharacterized membrane protein (UPF0127 family)
MSGDAWKRMARRNARIVACAAVVTASACRKAQEPSTQSPPLMAFDTSRVRFVTKSDTVAMLVEVARTHEQQTMGLMERPALADSAGMIFQYEADQPETAAFWMFRTRIPLDIAFVDSAGVIRSIKQMMPCETATAQNCPSYPPGVAYRSAIEANLGYFQGHGITTGDRVLIRDRDPTAK